MTAKSWYSGFSQGVSRVSGQPIAFILALVFTAAWVGVGPLFGFSDTWQLVMNTVSSIITFLMVFVIQNTQNRSTDAIQIKLDELIRANHAAHDTLLDLEDMEDEELAELRRRYVRLAQAARERRGRDHAPTPQAAAVERMTP